MIREGLGNSYQYCSANSSAENTSDDSKSLSEMGGTIYLSAKGSIGSGTIYKITYSINNDGVVKNIAVTTVGSSDTSSNNTTDEAISTDESYIGCYADVDGDGTVDGIIYADLAFDGSGYWGSSSYTYSYSAIDSSELREYEITQDSYTDTYSTSYGGTTITDYVTLTSTSFGTGLSNSENMKEAWENETYGTQNYSSYFDDVWSIDDIGESIGDTDSTWYVSSIGEFTAFADTFGITSSNYSRTYGLPNGFWSSSLHDTLTAFCAVFPVDSPAAYGFDIDCYCVRLGATF